MAPRARPGSRPPAQDSLPRTRPGHLAVPGTVTRDGHQGRVTRDGSPDTQDEDSHVRAQPRRPLPPALAQSTSTHGEGPKALCPGRTRQLLPPLPPFEPRPAAGWPSFLSRTALLATPSSPSLHIWGWEGRQVDQRASGREDRLPRAWVWSAGPGVQAGVDAEVQEQRQRSRPGVRPGSGPLAASSHIRGAVWRSDPQLSSRSPPTPTPPGTAGGGWASCVARTQDKLDGAVADGPAGQESA